LAAPSRREVALLPRRPRQACNKNNGHFSFIRLRFFIQKGK